MTVAREMKPVMVMIRSVGRGRRVIFGIAVSVRSSRCMSDWRIAVLLDFLGRNSVSFCVRGLIKEGAIELQESKLNE